MGHYASDCIPFEAAPYLGMQFAKAVSVSHSISQLPSLPHFHHSHPQMKLNKFDQPIGHDVEPVKSRYMLRQASTPPTQPCFYGSRS